MNRLSVNLNPETADVMRSERDNFGMSYTEQVRRAISLMTFVHEINRAGGRLLIEQDGKMREVITL